MNIDTKIWDNYTRDKFYCMTKDADDVSFGPWYLINGNWEHIIVIDNIIYKNGMIVK